MVKTETDKPESKLEAKPESKPDSTLVAKPEFKGGSKPESKDDLKSGFPSLGREVGNSPICPAAGQLVGQFPRYRHKQSFVLVCELA